MTLLGEDEDGERSEHNYYAPLHDIPVGDIDTDLVLNSVLKPTRYTKPDTASRLRGRVEMVIGYAVKKPAGSHCRAFLV